MIAITRRNIYAGQKNIKTKQGVHPGEFMFVSITVAMLVGAILGTWIFMQRTWTIETVRTNSRVDMIKALETLRNDLRLSSLTYMSFILKDKALIPR